MVYVTINRYFLFLGYQKSFLSDLEKTVTVAKKEDRRTETERGSLNPVKNGKHPNRKSVLVLKKGRKRG